MRSVKQHYAESGWGDKERIRKESDNYRGLQSGKKGLGRASESGYRSEDVGGVCEGSPGSYIDSHI